MAEAKLLQWNVQVGDSVQAGDAIAEVEADKANMEIETETDGTVQELHGTPGEVIAVGTVLAVLNVVNEKQGRKSQAPAADAIAGSRTASPLVQRTAAQKGVRVEDIVGSGEGGEVLMQDLESHLASRTKH